MKDNGFYLSEIAGTRSIYATSGFSYMLDLGEDELVGIAIVGRPASRIGVDSLPWN
jgi:hypothetical protein